MLYKCNDNIVGFNLGSLFFLSLVIGHGSLVMGREVIGHG